MSSPDLRAKPWFRIEGLNVIVNEGSALRKFGRHQHLRHQLIVVELGSYACSVNGEPLTVPPLGLVIVNPGDWHEDAYEPPMRYLALDFSLLRDDAPGDSGMRLLRPGLGAPAHCLSLDKALFKPLLERMVQESLSKGPFSDRVLEALMEVFLLNALRALPPESLSEELQELVGGEPESGLQAQLSKLFERHLNGPYEVPEMARDLGMSESSLAHRCKGELGVSPAAAFARHKMARAFELLKRTQMSVKEVGDFLGFKNPYHFSRVFKRHSGKTPGSVRG